jgi:hypothetical protein
MYSICRIFILLFVYQITLITAEEEWHLATETEDSFHPSPRASPHFLRKNSTHAIYFGGYFERVAINLGNNIFLNDLFLLDASNSTGKIRWIKVNYNNPENVPSPRVLGCVDYSPQLDALFLYGGVTFNANFSNMVFFSDSWKFSFETGTWTLLPSQNSPGARASMGCTYIDEYIYMTHGLLGNAANPQNTTWKWHLATNVWTELVIPDTSPIPPGRHKVIFERFPENTDLIFFGEGESVTPPFYKEVLFNDLWTFNRQTLEWKQFTIRDAPLALRDTYAYALTSDNWFLTHSGDSRINETLADTCRPPLSCFIRATPTDDTYFLHLKIKDNNNNPNMIADWGVEEDFEFRTPPLRRAVMVVFPLTQRVFLVAGYDWDGQNGTGEIYNPFTWVIKLKPKYLAANLIN